MKNISTAINKPKEEKNMKREGRSCKTSRFFGRFFGVNWLLIPVIGILLFSSVTWAAPLDLASSPPDILAGFIDVMYEPATEQFSASGFSASFDIDGSANPAPQLDDGNGIYTIDATINGAGELVSGTVSIGGTFSPLSYSSGTLLTGVLTDFGFSATDQPLEFTFDVTGGDAAGLYGGIGSEGGIILSLVDGFDGTWGIYFDNNYGMGMSGFGSAVSDNFAMVPIPGALWLLGSGLIGLIGLRRKFK